MSNLTQTNHTEDKLTLLAQKIDNTYREGLSIYTDTIANYTLEIEEIKSQINIEKELKEPTETKLRAIQKEKDHEERFLQKLNEVFTQKVHSIDELKTQYVDLMDDSSYSKILKQKENELKLALDELEEVELTLLQQELECINLQTALAPKQQSIIQLEEKLKKIELKKEYYALKNLQQLPQLALETNDEITTEVIEKEEVETNKS
ncbi:MAG: Unknown protein [uncultured Sulfurovum sp.]|uniref:Myosin heavy chain n=1 Tax=uncultured Sulfurovum sp. TaxID=269237 RepID=A0A6S6TPM8_9BACT|nr:MAG: Unknown protein [uncultured Sulfurovum sp.]